MEEEVRMIEYGDCEDSSGDEDRVLEWEIGLPSGDDLTPLSQSLVPSMLASAFSITPERIRTIQDVNRASWNSISSLRTGNAFSSAVAVAVDEVDRVGSTSAGSDPKKSDGGEAEEGDSETTLKRPRLVWTRQLHKRFVEVVGHLGIKNAVPKTIMQLMNVEGLSRENVASHLQKYRLYLKRIHGLTTEDESSSNQKNVKDGEISNGPIPVPLTSPPQVNREHMEQVGIHGEFSFCW